MITLYYSVVVSGIQHNNLIFIQINYHPKSDYDPSPNNWPPSPIPCAPQIPFLSDSYQSVLCKFCFVLLCLFICFSSYSTCKWTHMVFAFLCLTYFMKHNALKALSMFLDKCYFFLITKRFAIVGFPGSSAGKESSAMQETLIRFLGWEDPLEEVMATHSSILAWRIPIDRGAWQATVDGVAKYWTWLSD